MKKVLIFGSEGQLGFDLTRVFDRHYGINSRSFAEVPMPIGTKVDKDGYQVLGFNHHQVDIIDSQAVSLIINRENPDLVINAAAYNKVESAEIEKEKAFAVNAQGVENLAKASEQAKAIFLHVSTDYVFDGSKEFFIEDDLPNPLNVYGSSKLAGEEFVKGISSKYYLIRTSSVFGGKTGKQKKNFVDTMISKAQTGGTLKVVDDQIMSPTYSYDLASKIKELIEKPAPFGVYHITNQGSCSWYEFAVKILELMNLKTEVIPISTQESGTKVNRPKKSVLKNAALEKEGFISMPPWQDALERYLKEKYQK